MPKRNNHAQFSIECGATTDSFDNLKNNVRLKPKNFYQPLTFPPKKQLLLLSGPQIFQS